MVTSPELNVSLEPHLSEVLSPLQALLPEPLRSQLLHTLEQSANAGSHTAPVVPYALLSSISVWARSAEGLAALQGRKPPLQSSDYSMISLLAGTRTAPDRKFPTDFAPLGHDNKPLSPRDVNDRRAITTLLNALLSVLGSGVATWWAADRLRWQNEWKVLLALFVSFVVAASEAGLYLIWSSRRSQSQTLRRRQKAMVPHADAQKKIPSSTAMQASSDHDQSSTITNDPDFPQGQTVHGNLIEDVDTPNVQTHLTTEGLRARSQRPGQAPQ